MINSPILILLCVSSMPKGHERVTVSIGATEAAKRNGSRRSDTNIRYKRVLVAAPFLFCDSESSLCFWRIGPKPSVF